MNYLILAIMICYTCSSIYTHRFQEMTKMISRGFSNGSINPEVQTRITPTYVGALVIINGVLLLSIGLLIGYHFKWYYGLAVVLMLFFGISFLELISPFPKRKILLNKMLKEAEKNTIENEHIITTMRRYIANNYQI